MTAQTANPHLTSKHTLTLLSTVYEAFKASAALEGIDANELLVNIIIDRTIADGTLDGYTQNRILQSRKLVAKATETARALCRAGKFSSAITLDAIRACTANSEWASDYRAYVEDDIFKHGNPLKGPINRELGFRIRQAIGGEVEKTPDGKTVNVKVAGQIIQTYTPMTGFDSQAVG